MVTAQQATTFQRYSHQNATTVQSSLKCGCNAYSDVFTYHRWLAQGYQVMRGEHGVHLPVIIERQVERETDGQKTIELRKSHAGAVVFCRHQVKALNSKPETPASMAPAIIPAPAPKVESKAAKSPESDNIMAGFRII